MKYTHHSEYLPLETLMVKTVEKAFVSQDKIRREWKELNYLAAPDFEQAKKEYDRFLALLGEQVADLKSFPENEEVSMDSIYCRDASIATDFGVILCRMGKEGRALEPGAQEDYYRQAGIQILGSIEFPGTLEGGDVAWLDQKTLAVGRTYRTNSQGIAQLKSLLEPRGIEVLVVDLPHYKGKDDVFHLMSILSPVDENLAVVYSPLMPIAFRDELLSRGFELVEVPEEEFDSMGCNVLALGPRSCLMVEGNPVVESRLTKAGCRVELYKGDNISIYGGGGPTCLTRPLKRRCPV
jgi:N-dimethylarginine dimethylaminohydrolase